MDAIELVSPFDSHLHLRDNDALKTTASLARETFAGAIVMPNLTPPIDSIEAAQDYKARILSFCQKPFEPIVAIYLSDTLREEVLDRVKIVKLYPSGVTTGSENGVKNIERYDRLFAAMQEAGTILSVHGETNGFVLDREAQFATIYESLAKRFPRLKIIMEHISSATLAKLLDRYENLFATITLHHLLYTLDDLLGSQLNPHLFCKPIVKTPADRTALRRLAFGAHSKVSFGSDSAPHTRLAKESYGAAGIFSAPVLLPKLAELFEENSALNYLQSFVSDNAQKIYGIKLPRKTISLIKKPFVVQEDINGFIPMCAKETIRWSIR
ncbi:MAG: dihydroorotase [Helicobacteraceae bacterium]|nr:dihydroorotase [Helicobacteraceae bacterium]